VDVPEPVNIGHLFAEEDKSLESSVHAQSPEEQDNILYNIKEDIEELKSLTYKNLNEQDKEKLEKIEYSLNKASYESVSKDVAQQLVASKGILYNIKKYSGLLE